MDANVEPNHDEAQEEQKICCNLSDHHPRELLRRNCGHNYLWIFFRFILMFQIAGSFAFVYIWKSEKPNLIQVEQEKMHERTKYAFRHQKLYGNMTEINYRQLGRLDTDQDKILTRNLSSNILNIEFPVFYYLSCQPQKHVQQIDSVSYNPGAESIKQNQEVIQESKTRQNICEENPTVLMQKEIDDFTESSAKTNQVRLTHVTDYFHILEIGKLTRQTHGLIVLYQLINVLLGFACCKKIKKIQHKDYPVSSCFHFIVNLQCRLYQVIFTLSFMVIIYFWLMIFPDKSTHYLSNQKRLTLTIHSHGFILLWMILEAFLTKIRIDQFSNYLLVFILSLYSGSNYAISKITSLYGVCFNIYTNLDWCRDLEINIYKSLSLLVVGLFIQNILFGFFQIIRKIKLCCCPSNRAYYYYLQQKDF